jgi:peptidoglycan/xylan/chitin deacetylase (PgdA/CDA1 family)
MVERAFPWARLALGVGLLGGAGIVVATLAGAPPGPWWIAAALAWIVATLTLGIFFAQLGLFARPIVAVAAASAGDRLALTFDDGPSTGSTDEVLALLAERGHHATFFVIGTHAERERALLDRIVAAGHAIANHSFEHRHTTPFLAPEVLAEDLRRAERLLDDARGTTKRGRWFRAPVGIVSPRVAAAAKLASLELVSWTKSARDGTRRATVEDALARLRPHLRPGAILVLHDGAERNDRAPIAPAVLRRLLDELDAKKLRSVTLDELVGGSP